MSTEHPYSVGTPQYEFLQKDLAKAAANREERPWIFLVGHRPMYCSDKSEYNSHNGDPTTDNLQAQMEPLLHQYAVDGMFTGHMHMYERVFPVYQNQTVVCAFCVVGCICVCLCVSWVSTYLVSMCLLVLLCLSLGGISLRVRAHMRTYMHETLASLAAPRRSHRSSLLPDPHQHKSL
jgi:Calcineurin-like phosphoesterase